MLQKNRSRALGPPPPMMTMGKAAYVLVLCVAFDALGSFFAAFWVTGPLVAGLLCTAVGNAYIGEVWGLTGAACAAAGGTIGYFFSPALTAFGAVMAMLVGFIAWGTIGFLLVLTNRRVFKENVGQALWLVGGLAFDQIPIVNAIPALTPVIWRLYRAQIKKDKTVLAMYQKRVAEIEAGQRMAEVEDYMEMVRQKTEEARAAQDNSVIQSPEFAYAQ